MFVYMLRNIVNSSLIYTSSNHLYILIFNYIAGTEDFGTSPHLFTMLRCTDLIVDLFLLEDNRAMEPNEELTLSLDPIGMIDAIIINETKITIIDTDGKCMVPKIVVERIYTNVI